MTISHDVTVIIPNYNRVEPLIRAVHSVLLQSENVKRIIIIDDNSDYSLYKSYIDKLKLIYKINTDVKVDVIRQKINSGANVCRNIGIDLADTKYIAFLDSDDLWTENKIKVQMEHIYRGSYRETRPVLSCTGRIRVDGNFNIIAKQFSGSKLDLKKLLSSNYLGTLSSVIVERWVAEFIGGFDNKLPACQDWDFFIRLSKLIKYVGVSEPLCVYVDHDEDRITSGNKKRIYGHLNIRRKYLKNNLKYSNYSEFFRNLAEDYSELGNKSQAKKFLLHHKLASLNNDLERYMYYPIYLSRVEKEWKNVKANRYNKYREKPIDIDVKKFNQLINEVSNYDKS